MPSETLGTVQQREQALKSQLEEKRAGLNPEELRAMKKKLRRAQRKRRRLGAAAARVAKAEPAKAAPSQPAADESAES